MNMILEAKSLSVRRGGREVLAGVDLRIEGPGCTAIVGPNGAGKTTLLQTLLGLLPPDAGA
ncbi:MAG: ATP-binding cassette domain-containing protein, partial [Phycisphaerae bacterium]|nr:ATP-binding cassette domain-containing protein [Phycisphaerae bacterium]